MVSLALISKNMRWQLLIQCLILIIGLLFAWNNHNQHQHALDNKITNALNNNINVLSSGINDRFELYIFSLKALRGAVHGIGIDLLNYQSIANYSKSQNYELSLPGANGVGFIKKVDREITADFINKARFERIDKSFTIKTLNAHDKEQFIIQYIFPEKNNFKAIGLDIGSEKMRRNAALNSAFNNNAQLTGPITLVQADKKSHQGFLILLPIYKTIDAPKHNDERFKTLIGWAYSPLLIEEVLKSITQLGLNYFNLSDTTKETNLTFFNYGNQQDITNYSVAKSINILGRNWVINLSATNKFITRLNLAGKYDALIRALLLTTLVMLLVLSIQLIIYRKQQQAQIEITLSKKHEMELQVANSTLESEVKVRTQQLASINMLHRSILNSSSYTVIATDVNGLITEFNPAAERLLGYSASEVIGIQTPALFHLSEEVKDKANELSEIIGKPVAANFDVFVCIASFPTPDASQWTYKNKQGKHIPVKLTVSSLLNDEGKVVGFLGISFDLTEQIAHEKALAQAKELAEKASRAKSEFLANMSHEIRTPMNGIFGTLQLLQDCEHDKKSDEYLKQAIYSTKTLTTILNDILDFSKIEAGKLSIEKSPFNLAELLHNLQSDLAIPANEKNIFFKINSNVTHKHWLGDPVRIRQIVLNLVSNAIKFTQVGGVTLDVSMVKNNEILIVVSDTGIGMTKESISRLFERFEQADTSTTRKYGGTGLGLPITKSLISLMGGRIEINSELNVGSQFYVYLPLQNTDIVSNELNLNNLKYPNLKGKTILIAEDNQINQLVAKAMLSPTNADIVIANDGIEAVSMFKQTSPSIIFMDIQMPNMDGIEACKHIKAINSEQVIVALTANVLPEQKQVYKTLFNGYISKPMDKLELIAVLTRSLHHLPVSK